MSELLKSVDERTRLAGTNKLEILLFELGQDARTGRCETYGINVFKVREVMRAPAITHAPDMPNAVVGMISLRGVLMPVIDLAVYAGVESQEPRNILIVTEYNRHTQGFLVKRVDTILRLDWSKMKVPPEMLGSQMGSLVTAVAELSDGRLAMMMDVERVLTEIGVKLPEQNLEAINTNEIAGRTVFYVDDSPVARKQIENTLKALGVRGIAAMNGKQAWQDLQKLADMAEVAGRNVASQVNLILTDVEMPEMDGYMLTRKIKEDRRFNGVPVLMHSSLSSLSTQKLGRSVGVDEYVSKFEPARLAETLVRMLKGDSHG